VLLAGATELPDATMPLLEPGTRDWLAETYWWATGSYVTDEVAKIGWYFGR
jgi:hypothetical protein